MSRIGNEPITIPNGVEVTSEQGGRFGGLRIKVKGPKGELSEDLNGKFEVKIENGVLTFGNTKPEDQTQRSRHGLYRTLIANMVKGVSEGYAKSLEIIGIGYKAQLKGRDLDLTLGYNHPIPVKAPEGIEFKVDDGVKITVMGINKQQVGEVSAQIRRLKKPEPYKGKGIRYDGEYVRRKEGKSGAAE